MQLALYDKYLQILDEVKKGKLSYCELDKYLHIIRTEVRIKNDKLNSNIYSKKYPDKDLKTYYNENVTEELYSDFVNNFFGENDFYRVDIAIKIIRKNSELSNSIKCKLCELIKLINKVGYTKGKKMWIKKYSKSTFRNHKILIESLSINLLTFDKKINSEKINLEKLDNFTLLKNSVSEERNDEK